MDKVIMLTGMHLDTVKETNNNIGIVNSPLHSRLPIDWNSKFTPS